jgi:hypothetical protein
MCEKLDVIVDNELSLPSSQSIYHAYTYNQNEQLKQNAWHQTITTK